MDVNLILKPANSQNKVQVKNSKIVVDWYINTNEKLEFDLSFPGTTQVNP